VVSKNVTRRSDANLAMHTLVNAFKPTHHKAGAAEECFESVGPGKFMVPVSGMRRETSLSQPNGKIPISPRLLAHFHSFRILKWCLLPEPYTHFPCETGKRGGRLARGSPVGNSNIVNWTDVTEIYQH